ncbi:hypothetical protein FF38_13320 [Lucilia cuprina]|uniref:Gustatory receptor n=1 Tax=Lucilia cuprina TaxID=7375 RepID=A0A0L0BTU9_LUCCU|nr:hypothetical protein FF38_13320 [Lucilia cuprina]
MVIWLRLKGDKLLDKWLNIFLELQIKYFDKLQKTSVDGKTKIILIFNIIMMSTNSLATLVIMVPSLLDRDWLSLILDYLDGYCYALEHYIMLHHILLLSYINHCLSLLNNKLRYGPVKRSLVNNYFQLVKLLQEINDIYGPMIFNMFLGILLTSSIYADSILIYIKNGEYKLNLFEYFVQVSALLLMWINLYLYFLICDRVNETSRETTIIILEYSTRSNDNQEVELLFLEHLVLRLKINICGMFDLDLSSFFAFVAAIFLQLYY